MDEKDEFKWRIDMNAGEGDDCRWKKMSIKIIMNVNKEDEWNEIYIKSEKRHLQMKRFVIFKSES